MGIGMLRRHYANRQLTATSPPEPTRGELLEQLQAERAKAAELEGQLAAAKVASEPPSAPQGNAGDGTASSDADPSPTEVAPVPPEDAQSSDAPKPARARR